MLNLDWRIFKHCVSWFPRRDSLKSFLLHVCKSLLCVSNFYTAWKHVRDVSSLADPSFTATLVVGCGSHAKSFFCAVFAFFSITVPAGCEIKRDGLQENGFCRLAFFILHLFACWCTELLAVVACRCNKVTPCTTALILLDPLTTVTA